MPSSEDSNTEMLPPDETAVRPAESRPFAVLSFLALSLFVSAYLSLGGKPLFGKAMLDD